jgi:uncharacterized protein (TIGR03437 family)
MGLISSRSSNANIAVLRLVFCAFLCCCSALWAQPPHINYRGVANAASFMPAGLPGGAIARGSVITVFGSNLGPASSPTLTFPLQTTLGNVSITLTQGSTVVNAIPIYVSPGQVNAIVPSNTPLGSVSLQLTFNNSRSNPAPIVITTSSVGIFAVAGGRGPGILQNYVSANQQPINALAIPAQPNQTITLWGTGLGPVTFPDNVAPTAGNLPTQTEVFVGGVSASIAYSGRTPCCSGIDQIVFAVPANAPVGCWVAVYVRTGGTAVSNVVSMAITQDGSPCTEPSNALAQGLIGGNRTARVMAARTAVHHDVGSATTNDGITDIFGAYVAQETAGQYNFDPNVSLPPAGTCTSYAFAGDFTQNSGFPPGLPASTPTGRSLDGGTISVSGANGTANSSAGTYLAPVGGAIPTIPNSSNSLLFNPGNFTAKGAGGGDVASFQTTLNIPASLNWTNRDQLQSITRNQGFTVNWTGAAPGNTVFVSGAAADLPTNSSAVFICTAHAGDTSLTVPADVLANFPSVRNRLIESRGVIYVGQWPIASPTTFSASGLDSGIVLPIEANGRTVTFK